MRRLSFIAIIALAVTLVGLTQVKEVAASLTSAVESQFSAFWADKFPRFNKSLLKVVNSDEC